MNDLYDAEYQYHEKIWIGFTKLMTGTVIFVALLLLAMAVVLL